MIKPSKPKPARLTKGETVVARLVVEGIPAMGKKQLKQLADWLYSQAFNIETGQKNYAAKYTARLYK